MNKFTRNVFFTLLLVMVIASLVGNQHVIQVRVKPCFNDQKFCHQTFGIEVAWASDPHWNCRS